MKKLNLHKPKFLKRNNILKDIKRKKERIITSIPKMNDNDLYSLYCLLVDVFKKCQEEMNYRNR